MKRTANLILLSLALFVMPAAAEATVITPNASRTGSAFTAPGQTIAEGPAGLGKYVWYADQTPGEAVLRGFDQANPANPNVLATVNGTTGVGAGPIGSVGGIAFLPGRDKLLVLDKANDRLVYYYRSNSGGSVDPVDYPRSGSHHGFDAAATGSPAVDLLAPNGIAVDPPGNGRFYISDTGHARVIEVDGYSMNWLALLALPSWSPSAKPGAMTLDTATGRVFVSIEGAARIDVLKKDLTGSDAPLTAPTAGDFTALSAEAPSNRLFAAKTGELDVFSLSTGTLLGSVADIPFGNQIAGISALGNLHDLFLSSTGADHAKSFLENGPPTCAAPAQPLAVTDGDSITFTPNCDDADHSALKEFSIENTPARGTAQLAPGRGAITYSATAGELGADSVKYKVTTQNGISALEDYPISVVHAPTLSVSAPADGANLGSPVSAAFTTTNASTVTCQWDAEPAIASCASPLGPKSLSAGAHALKITAFNAAGTSVSVTRNFTVIAPPTISITAPASGQVVGSPVTASFTLGGGAAASVSCQWDAEPATGSCTSPQGPKALTPGAHSFSVTVSNVGGTATDTRSFTVIAAPTLNITSPVDGAQSGLGINPAFALGGGAATSVTCQFDNGPVVSSCTSPQGFRLAAPGVHTFTVTASNVAGTVTKTHTYTAVAPPDVSIVSPANVEVVGSPATASFSVAGGTASSVTCQWDAEPVIDPCASPQGPKTLDSGAHTFTVTASNAASSVTVTRNFSIAKPVQQLAVEGPVVRETTNLELDSGDVFVKTPDSDQFVKLTGDMLVPLGTIIDAQGGKAHLTLANADSSTYDGIFWEGVFQVTQGSGDKPIATMKLRADQGAQASIAEAADAMITATSTASLEKGFKAWTARRRGKKKNGLWGDGHGNFRTSGSGGSATVRGTRWYVADYANGSLFTVARGVVTINPVHGKNFPLKAGHSVFVFKTKKKKK